MPLRAAQIDPPFAWSNDVVTLNATVSWPFTCPPDGVSAAVANNNAIIITVIGPDRPQCYGVQPVLSAQPVSATVGPLAPGVYEVRTRLIIGVSAYEDTVRTLYVRDASAPFTVQPQVLFGAMREVELRGSFCTNCTPQITIGGRPASIVRRDAEHIVVAIPSGVGFGTHDVVLTQGETSSTSRAAVTIARTDNIPRSLTERILVPLFWAGEGAHGSRWTTDLWFRNENLFGIVSTDNTIGICTSLISPCPYQTLDWDSTQRHSAVEGGPLYPRGLWITLARGAAEGLKTTALIRDLSRQSEAIGAELPIVHEDEFANEVTLVRVPVDERFRTALRVYGSGGGTIQLLIYAIDEDISEQLIVNQQMNLQGSADPRIPPISFFTDLAAQYPRVAEADRVRITVRSNDRIWAFASVTNNATQHVTNIRPQ